MKSQCITNRDVDDLFHISKTRHIHIPSSFFLVIDANTQCNQ